MFCPRNVHTPESAVPCLKCDSGTANMLKPGAKSAGGAACPVTEYRALRRVYVSGTLRVRSVVLVALK